jgi:DNA-binding NtrC family response regulator
MANDATPTATRDAHTLLVVDDERSLRFSIGEWARDLGFTPLEATAGSEALAQVRERSIDVVLLDLRLGEEDGMQVLRDLREEDPTLPVIMLTGHGTMDHAIEATRLGAFHFITKPPDLDQLGALIQTALEHSRLQREVQHWRSGGGSPLVGESPVLKTALERLGRAAGSENATVLILGETGVGKELMARQLHALSKRAAGPFIDLNCSAIPEQLLESELFGHERGAFTDAKRFRKGLFELAHRGTLFLDEIGEMPPQLQAKLLRVLESQTFRRVGGNEDVRVDVRIVAATHRDLKKRVDEGRFREDLYFRLKVVPIEIPPLRERAGDVAELVRHFTARFCAELGRPPAKIAPAALAALSAYAWPGNVRELRNAIERIVLIEMPVGTADNEIRSEYLPAEITGARTGSSTSHGDVLPEGRVRPLAEVERMAIEHALGVCGGNKTKAAGMLGISRQTLRTKLNEFALDNGVDDGGDEDA